MRRALAVVLLLVSAGCGGPLAGDAAPDSPATATPAPVPTAEAPTYPPGVEAGSVNATRLAAATARTLDGSMYAWTVDRLRGVPDQSLTTTFVGPRTRLRVAGPGRYLWTNATVSTRASGFTVERVENATYATGTRLLRYDGTNTTTRRLRPADVGPGTRLVTALVARHLAVDSVEVTPLANGSVAVTGRGTNRTDWLDYSLRALIAADGTVLRFQATYTRNDRVRLVRFRLDRTVPFEPPAWAPNGTRPTATASPTDAS